MKLLLLWLLFESAVTQNSSTGTTTGQQEEVSTCREALGMNSGQIQDISITASSSYDQKSVGPQNSRIRTEKLGGAWCPKTQINRDAYEWLEIDLGELKVVTLVETQGRFGNGQGQEFAPNYRLEFQRESGQPWIRYKDFKRAELLKGNSNTYLAELRELRPPVIARRIRFIPHSIHPRTVCMRVEVYGCAWTGDHVVSCLLLDGILSYNMRQGDKRSLGMDFSDFTYDGNIQDGFMSNGLGQLTDLNEGLSDFHLDLQNIGKKGHEWIAWKSDAQPEKIIEILFRFDQVRNFSAVQITANNMPSKDIGIFKRVFVFFSVSGKAFSPESVKFSHARDNVESARRVLVPVPYRLGQLVKLLLYFDSKWMMISEIRFLSEKVNATIDDEILSDHEATVPEICCETNTDISNITTNNFSNPVNERRRKLNEITKEKGVVTAEAYIGIAVGSSVVFLLFGAAVFLLLYCRYHRRSYLKNHCGLSAKSTCVNDNMNFNLNDLTPAHGKFSNNLYNVVTNEHFQKETEPELNLKLSNEKYSSDRWDSRREVTENRQNSLSCTGGFLLGPRTSSANCSTRKMFHQTLHGFTSVVHPTSMMDQRNSYLPVLPVVLTSELEINDLEDEANITSSGNRLGDLEYPRERLRLVEHFGYGIFGEIFLCETFPSEYMQTSSLIGNNELPLVVVKTLDIHASEQIRRQFRKEVEKLLTLSDPNIARLVGLCRKEEPLGIVLEYTCHGNLNLFLKQQNINKNGSISYGCLIYMATQIASGMESLEKLNILHRDLATRNCLVGQQYCIKISDYGMSQALFSTDYYKVEGRTAIPIRWMAWESVVLGKFTPKSDVWSFAVTLWEILTLAVQQPFCDLLDVKVIENCVHHSQDDGQEIYLQRPSNCPREIFDLLMECWNREEIGRPSFGEIHMFLKKKNLGYNPNDEYSQYRSIDNIVKK